MKSLDLSRTQWQVMVRFSMFEMPCSQKTLLKSMEIDAAHLTRVLDQLEQKNLIKRIPDRNDRRSINIQLTQQGEALLPKIKAIMFHESEVMLNGLSLEEKQQLEKLLQISIVIVLVDEQQFY